MGITIPPIVARQRLDEAFEWAESNRPVPVSWEQFARQTFQMKAMTYTPVLGTVLLARSTDDRIDPLSIKEGYGSNTYSLRDFCHDVLVPAARELHFSIRNTGPEPINNQPFFRYQHMTTVEKVRNRAAFDRFVEGVARLSSLNRDQALGALAAFLRVAIAEAQRIESYIVGEGELTVPHVVSAVTSFLQDPAGRPWKAQALAAAAFDVTHADVRSRRLNDPSRDYPGDVQAFENDQAMLTAEVRAKVVRPTEVERFVAACRSANIDRAFMIVLLPGHDRLPREILWRSALDEYGVLLTIIQHPEDLLLDVFVWSDMPLNEALEVFAKAVLERLREIEAQPDTLSQWVTLIGEHEPRRQNDDSQSDFLF